MGGKCSLRRDGVLTAAGRSRSPGFMPRVLFLLDDDAGEDGLWFSGVVAVFEESPFEVGQGQFLFGGKAELSKDLLGRRGEDGAEKDGEMNAGLAGVIEAGCEAIGLALIFGE